MNDLDRTSVPKLQKPKLRIKKPRRSDIKWSNPCGDQTTHFVSCTENFNAQNFCSNCRKTKITFDAKPTICVSSANEKKTQVGWAIAIW
jgi:hypothetical protein